MKRLFSWLIAQHPELLPLCPALVAGNRQAIIAELDAAIMAEDVALVLNPPVTDPAARPDAQGNYWYLRIFDQQEIIPVSALAWTENGWHRQARPRKNPRMVRTGPDDEIRIARIMAEMGTTEVSTVFRDALRVYDYVLTQRKMLGGERSDEK